MIVIKFGGTSVGDADRVASAIDIVAERQHLHPVIVVSALSGVTNDLVAASEADTWRSDTHSGGPAVVMSQLDSDPSMPRPLGIFRDVQAPIFEDAVHEQIHKAQSARGEGTLEKLIYSGETWSV